MKVYGTYVKYYTIEAEVPDDATTEEIYDAVNDEIDKLTDCDLLCADDEQIESIIDENENYIWEI
jgi:hypothetical protein